MPAMPGHHKSLVVRGNRTYIDDPTLAYPYPVDLAEVHRQNRLTQIALELYGGPLLSAEEMVNEPPKRILEVACGNGFWSMMCHSYFSKRGKRMSFVGLDILPPGGKMSDPEMDWKFVQCDVLQTPWPLETHSFDIIMAKDSSMFISEREASGVLTEYLRLLKPGGILEVWECDSTIRMLRPHVPNSSNEAVKAAARLGAYSTDAGANTPLSSPVNKYIIEYNSWVSQVTQARGLSPTPCTSVGAWLVQEEHLSLVRSKRFAVPLSKIQWERGVELSPSQTAIRRTVLELAIGRIHALEPLLKDVREASMRQLRSCAEQRGWDAWLDGMTQNLICDEGTCYGECLEIGAWSARKKSTAPIG